MDDYQNATNMTRQACRLLDTCLIGMEVCFSVPGNFYTALYLGIFVHTIHIPSHI